MKKILLLSGVACLIATNASAFEYKEYISLKISEVRTDADSKLGLNGQKIMDKTLRDYKPGVRLAYGVQIPALRGYLRPELEIGTNIKSKDSGYNEGTKFNSDVAAYTGFLNVYYDIETCTDFKPYVGGGIGYASLKTRVSSIYVSNSERVSNLAWNLGAGVVYDINESLALDVGYRYTDLGHVRGAAPGATPWFPIYMDGEHEFTTHEVSLGLRYSF